MNLSFPTLPHLQIVQAWGNPNAKMYANGRHMGVDIAGPMGSAIYAAAPGMVDEVNLEGAHGYGRHVIIQHNGFKTLYAHLHTVSVKHGYVVEAGAVIGAMGGDPTDSDPIDGASTGPHLHFEVILPGQPQTDFIQTFAGYTVAPFVYLLNHSDQSVTKIGRVIERDGVRVRISAGTAKTDTIIGAVSYNRSIEIVEIKGVGGNLWARIRSLRPEWVCAIYQKRELIQLKDVPVVIQDEPPTPQIVDEKAIRLDEVNRLIVLLQARKSDLE